MITATANCSLTTLLTVFVTMQTVLNPGFSSHAKGVSLPVATILDRTLAQEPEQQYFLYIPSTGSAGVPVFVTVHGISRNATQHMRHFAPLAEHYGVVLVAPLFPRDHFRDYQRLGRRGKGKRADHALDKIVTEVGSLTGATTDTLYLFGYSGGGQFVHRYALAHP
ncbi:MAG: hypothetical protein ACRERD_00925, partial [Candidatus Binatia bacterium]